MTVEIQYASADLFKSFHAALDEVAREQVYIEMTEARPFEETAAFQTMLISSNWPSYYAVSGGKVVGWVDINPSPNLRLAHRGFLGMGLVREFRGKGLGTQLLTRALEHAKSVGLEKVELHVFTDNLPAVRLYKKCGFREIGVIRHYRKLNGRYFDSIEMEVFL